ncbi:MAG: sigma-54-dependent Fis family transcriptional regulator [Syntrophaceae bacterium]|nr:sigma-54-dependent Fis family transcriptional regulator [Syntrophaceae bacterium]
MKRKVFDSSKKEQIISKAKNIFHIFRNLPGVFFVIDDKSRPFIWNESTERIGGYTSEKAKEIKLENIFSVNDSSIIENAINEAFHAGESSFETMVVTTKGKRIPYFFSLSRALIEEKSCLIGQGIDISRFKHAQESIMESESLYRTFAERMTEGVALISKREIVFANNKFASILGFLDATEIIGKNSMIFISKDFEEYFKEFFDFIEEGINKERFFHARWIKKNDQEIWVEGKGNLFQWKGKPTVLLTARDITNTKMKEISMQEETAHLRRENVKLRSSIKDRYRFGDIIGKSVAIQGVYERCLNSAATNANVIIYGESGTGKELVAKAIHRISDRSQKNFVPVNCAAIPENLVESEFFGYKKGAFTGANTDKEGYLDKANGGTLFLDEVGELGLNIQAKLLRAIEDGGYLPVGSNVVKHSDFRIIAATNKNLMEYTKQGLMREDFFYRIHIIPIQIPPLRQRKEDIPLLVEHFVRLISPGSEVISVPGNVLEMLKEYDWPGNVRELHNVVQRYLMVDKVEFLTSLKKQPLVKNSEQLFFNDMKNDLEFHEKTDKVEESPVINNLSECTEKSEKAAILAALNHNRWNKGKTAETLNISRKTLHRKMKRFGLG